MLAVLDPQKLYFPPVNSAHSSGILAIGGAITTDWVKLAYKSGVFPWFDEDSPITWWAPDPRMVVFPQRFKPSKSMRNILNRNEFTITYNTSFDNVIENCQKSKRKDQNGTWITDEMLAVYSDLHRMGIAKSVEVWQNNQLVGGLYGMDLGNIFCGESMFSHVSNASKVAFCWLVEKLKNENYYLLDCQVYNPHLELLGAVEISRDLYMEILHSKKK